MAESISLVLTRNDDKSTPVELLRKSANRFIAFAADLVEYRDNLITDRRIILQGRALEQRVLRCPVQVRSKCLISMHMFQASIFSTGSTSK